MTNEQINKAIAEACGWKPTTDGGICWDCNGAPIVTLPDYCNDLNAMHEAEKSLSEEQKEEYFYYLVCVFGNWPKAIQANAHQRAEAFLRTIGKWEESNDT